MGRAYRADEAGKAAGHDNGARRVFFGTAVRAAIARIARE